VAGEQIWRIAKWASTFENSASRKLKALHWVSMPVNFASNGYQCLLDEFGDDAPAIYGAWCALVSVAAQCNRRGVLASDSGKPLRLNHVARTTGFPESVFRRLFDWASSDSVKWLIPASYDEVKAEFSALENQSSVDSANASADSANASADSANASADSADASAEKPEYPTDQTLPTITRTKQTPTPTNQAYPAAGAGGGGLCFDLEAGKRAAERLRKRFTKDELPTELCFHLGVAAVAIEPTFISTIIADASGGKVKSPRRYILSACQNMAKRHGWEWERLCFEIANALNNQGAVA
jgi:hypothetical protein